MKKLVLSLTAILSASFLFGQEALKSTEEEYYDFLSLQGIVERPTLGYRTLSDSEWKFIEKEVDVVDEAGNPLTDEAGNKLTNLVMPEHPWQNNNLGTKRTLWQGQEGTNWFTRGFDHSLKLKIYGPEWYNSFNTAAPYGQNDGALWQGKGYNSSLTGGARLEAYGFEVTLKPQVCFSQNLSFDYITPNYSGENYAGKATAYGYYGITSIDSPQRFGDKAFWTFDWGDTEIRWTWKTFTTGLGTQNIWLGPAKLNPIIHSNNAPTYPKFDIGLRKTPLYMPYFDWHLGDIEFRTWWGQLTESNYFDNDTSNDKNLISGFSFYYGFPGIFKGLSFGLNRTMISKWNNITSYALFAMFVPGMSTTAGADKNDQRASITIDYLLPKVGLELYLEWGRNDYTSGGIVPILQYPFHTEGWTFGVAKEFNTKNTKFEIVYEYTKLDCSQDYDRVVPWYTSFYCHHIIQQGYTNKGQVLGAGIGTGANSHYLGLNIYSKTNKYSFFIQRTNPDLDYTWYIDSKRSDTDAGKNVKVLVDAGASLIHFFSNNLSLTFGYTGELIINNQNIANPDRDYKFNSILNLGMKYNF